jgi:hypothetical protein
MSRWETTSTLEADVATPAVWEKAYSAAETWPKWNVEIKRARMDGPLALGATARIVFRTGLRLRFCVVEYEKGRLFTDEPRLPGARMGHRHLVEPTANGASRLTNTIYIEGPPNAPMATHPRPRCPNGRSLALSAQSLSWRNSRRTTFPSTACSG